MIDFTKHPVYVGAVKSCPYVVRQVDTRKFYECFLWCEETIGPALTNDQWSVWILSTPVDESFSGHFYFFKRAEDAVAFKMIFG